MDPMLMKGQWIIKRHLNKRLCRWRRISILFVVVHFSLCVVRPSLPNNWSPTNCLSQYHIFDAIFTRLREKVSQIHIFKNVCCLFVQMSPRSTNQPPFWVPTDHLYLVWSAPNWQLTYCLLSVWSTNGNLSTLMFFSCDFIREVNLQYNAVYRLYRHKNASAFQWILMHFNLLALKKNTSGKKYCCDAMIWRQYNG